jgi:hypothetical protein
VLEKVCEYFYYNEKHKNSKDVPDIDVPAELCLELLMAADYLNGEFLLTLSSVCFPLLATLSKWSLFWLDRTLTLFFSLNEEKIQNTEK